MRKEVNIERHTGKRKNEPMEKWKSRHKCDE